jgi:spoIIIJ-associated protein
VTVDEAIQVALNRLGVSRDRVEIEIVHHPRGGFLGVGAPRAKVRATVRKGAFEDGEEFDMSTGGGRSRRGRRQSRRRRGGRRQGGRGDRQDSTEEQQSADDSRPRPSRGGGRQGGQSSGAQRGRDDQGQQRGREGQGQQRGREGQGQQRGRDAQRQQRGGQGGQPSQESGEGRAERGGKSEGGRSRRGGDRRGRGRGRGERQQRASNDSSPAELQQSSGTEQTTGQPPAPSTEPTQAPLRAAPPEPRAARLEPEEIRERAVRLVSGLLERMAFDAEVSAEFDEAEGETLVRVRTEAEGLLIGRRGQTLDAVEHLINRMVFAGESGADNRIALDVGGYRERRREALLELADRLKARALTQGRRVQVSPMSPRDRKVLQAALAGEDAVETRVLGSGFYRRVLIVPVGVEETGAPLEESSASIDETAGEPVAGSDADIVPVDDPVS